MRDPVPRRLLRALRKLREDLEKSPGTVTLYDNCPECGSRVAFEFFDIPGFQTKFARCLKCGEAIRWRLEIEDVDSKVTPTKGIEP